MGAFMDIVSLDTLVITPEMLNLISEVDEFKGAWQQAGRLTPDRLSSLKRVATIESIGLPPELKEPSYRIAKLKSFFQMLTRNLSKLEMSKKWQVTLLFASKFVTITVLFLSRKMLSNSFIFGFYNILRKTIGTEGSIKKSLSELKHSMLGERVWGLFLKRYLQWKLR